jgi:hypothetical protein
MSRSIAEANNAADVNSETGALATRSAPAVLVFHLAFGEGDHAPLPFSFSHLFVPRCHGATKK